MTRKRERYKNGREVAHGRPDNHIQHQIAQALSYQRSGFIGNAEQIYNSILAVHPHQPDCLHYLGLVYSEQGKFRQALESIRKSLRINADNPVYHDNHGLVLGKQNRLAEAERAHKKAIALKPDYAEAWYNLGVVCFRQNKLAEAMEAYQQAIRFRPDYIKAMYNLAFVLEKLGQTEESSRLIEDVLKITPDSAPAHNTLGLALMRLGGIQNQKKAEHHFWQAISLDPSCLDAYLGLGRLFEEGNQIEDAIRCYRKVLELESGHMQARSNLALTLIKDQQLPEAETLLTEMLEQNPAHADALSGKGWILFQQGNFTGAERNFSRAIAENNETYPAYLGLALSRKYSESDQTIINDMVNLNNNPNVFINFALGKIHDDMHSYDRAFAYYRQGNDIKNRKMGFSKADNTKFADRIIDTFSEEFISLHEGAGNPTELPVFVVGTPRSGTTLVERIISSHPATFGAGELRHIPQQVAQLKRQSAGEGSYPEALKHLHHSDIRKMADDYLLKIKSQCNDDHVRRITDKMPHNFLYVGHILLLFPHARIIHCIRHPLDACLSMYFTLFQAGHDYSFDLENLGHFYKNYLRLMEHWSHLYSDKIYDVEYTDTVTNLEQTARRLIRFCGLEWSDRCLQFQDAGKAIMTASAWQARQPIYKTSLERWKRYDKHIGVLKEILAGYY